MKGLLIKIKQYKIKTIRIDGKIIKNIKQLLRTPYWDILNNIIFWLDYYIEYPEKKWYPYRLINSTSDINLEKYTYWRKMIKSKLNN